MNSKAKPKSTKDLKIARVVPEKKGGFTKTQWMKLIKNLHDPNHPAGNYMSPNLPRFKVKKKTKNKPRVA